MENIVKIAVAVTPISALIAAIVTYQDSPKGKKWRCVLPLGVYVVLVLGGAFALGVMKGVQMVDIQMSRYVFLGICVVVTAFSFFIAIRSRST